MDLQTYRFSVRAVIAFLAIAAACFVICRGGRPLEWDSLALTPATRIGSNDVGVFGRGSAPPINVLQSEPFSLTAKKSATVAVTPSEYTETVVYSHPDWTPVYAEVGATAMPLDFLGAGVFVVAVFSVEAVSGSVEFCLNEGRPRPPETPLRQTREAVAEARELAISEAALNAAPGARETLCIDSAPTAIWPRPVLTRVETVFAVVPEDTTDLFVSTPSYGYVVEGHKEHLGAVVHRTPNTTLYRAVCRVPSMAGGFLADIPETSKVVSVTVVYPNVAPSAVLSPKTRVHMLSAAKPNCVPGDRKQNQGSALLSFDHDSQSS